MRREIEIQMDNEQSPVIIIAAARSGTKFLRAVLACSHELVDFPYDMNYIWKFGNYHIPHDELTVADLTPKIAAFIKNRFHKLISKDGTQRVLEKTVSNSLRVEFIRAVFPECKIIHLYRDGRDVAADARFCWQSSMVSDRIQRKSDLIKKALNFPITAAWPYLFDYLSTYAGRIFSKENHVKSWGPRFKGIDDAVQKHSLLEVCGMQWVRSVELSLQALAGLQEYVDYIDVRYEDLVTKPILELNKIADFLKLKNYDAVLDYAKANTSAKYVGFSKQALSKDELDQLESCIRPYLLQLKYN